MSDDVKVGIDPRGAEAGAKRVNAAFKSIQEAAAKHVGGAGRSFSGLYKEMSKFNSLKGVNSSALKSLQDLSTIMTTLSRASGPSGATINNIRGLSSALSGFKAPSASQIKNLNDFGTALRNITSGPTSARIGTISGLSAALAGFKAPTANSAANLQAFFNVLNNAKFSPTLAANLRSLSASVSGLAPFATMANQMASSMNSLGTASQRAGQHFINLKTQGLSLSQTLLRTHAALQGMAAILGARSIINAATDYQKMELALKATLGSTVQASGEMQFAQQVAEKYGVSIQSLGGSYAQLLAAAQGTNITVGDSRKIFEGVTQAVRVYGLSTTDAEGVYRALTQIVSKGTVQMEELRGQLGDRLPGAVQIFAQGLGVTTSELMKMTQAGEVTGETLRKGLLGFSEELKRRTSGAVDEAAQSLPAALGRIQTAFTNFSDVIVKSGFGEGLTEILNRLSDLMGNSAVIALVNGLGAAFKAAASNAGLLATLGLGMLVVKIAPAVSGFVQLHAGLMAMSRGAGGLTAYMGVLTGAMTGAQTAALGLNMALGVIGVAAVAITLLSQQLNLVDRASRDLDKSTKALSESYMAQTQTVDELITKYAELNDAQRAQEGRKLLNAQDGALDAVEKLGASVQKMAAYSEVLRANGLGEYVSAIQNPAKASTETLSALVAKLNDLQQTASEAGDKEIAGFAGTLADLVSKFITARDRLYDIVYAYNLLKSGSADTAKKLTEQTLGYKSLADSAKEAASSINGVSAAMKSLNDQSADIDGLKKAVQSKDKAAVAAYLGRTGATDGERKMISTDADEYARKAVASQYNTKSGGDWFNNEASVGKQYYNQVVKEREAELYGKLTNNDMELKKWKEQGEILLGTRKASGPTRTPQSPYSVDRAGEAVSQLNKYLDPDQKAGKARLDIEQAINVLLKENPKYLQQVAGTNDKISAADKIRQQAYEQIGKTLSQSVPELRESASINEDYRQTVDAINELYELRSDMISSIGDKEDLLAAAALRRENDLAEARINNMRRVEDERMRSYDIATYDKNRGIKDALGGAGLMATFGTVGGDVAGQAVGTSRVRGVQLMTSEYRVQEQVRQQMVDIERQIAAQVEYGSIQYKKLTDQARELLTVEAQREQKIREVQEHDELLSRYPKFSERNRISPLSFQDDYLRMSAMSQGGQYRGEDYSGYSEQMRAMAKDHLPEVEKAFQQATFNASTFGQTVNAVMDRAGQALTEFVQTGKLDFRSLISDMIAEIMRLTIIQPMVQGISRGLSSIFNVGSLFMGGGLFHSGGVVGSSGGTRAMRLHSGGMVPRGGISQGNLRSWEYMTQLPKGAEVITQYDRRNQMNPRFGDTMQVLLKANEEVLMPNDPRRHMKSYHTGGVVGNARETMDSVRGGSAASGGGVTINNNITLSVPEGASRGPQQDAAMARQLAEELTRAQDTQLRVALQYRNRNSRSMQVN